MPSLEQGFPSRHVIAIPPVLSLRGRVEELPLLAIMGKPGPNGPVLAFLKELAKCGPEDGRMALAGRVAKPLPVDRTIAAKHPLVELRRDELLAGEQRGQFMNARDPQRAIALVASLEGGNVSHGRQPLTASVAEPRSTSSRNTRSLSFQLSSWWTRSWQRVHSAIKAARSFPAMTRGR